MPALRSVFEYDNYKKYLADWLKTKRHEVRGIQTRLGEALQCHPTHITLILKHDNHLSIEQAGRFSRFAEHVGEEAFFFQLLLHRARAGDSFSREIYDKEIGKKIQEKLDQAILSQVKTVLSEEAKITYYSNWVYSAIHMAVTVPAMRTRERVSKSLGVSAEATDEALGFLVKSGLLHYDGKHYLPGESTIHLSRNSIHSFRQHVNWRLKAIEHLNQHVRSSLHYTSVLTMSRSDEPKVRQILQEAVDRSRALIGDSKEESVYCMGIDWFQVSSP